MKKEPLGSFPYISPSEDLKSSYPEFFGENLQKNKKKENAKDILISFWVLFFLIIAFPVILLLFISNFIEGLIIAAHRGPFFVLLLFCFAWGKDKKMEDTTSYMGY